MKYILQWDNLALGKCPSCGEDWSLDVDGFYKCENHQKGFKIGAAKVAKIISDIERRENERMPHYSSE